MKKKDYEEEKKINDKVPSVLEKKHHVHIHDR
jgi:hypothetical protein